MRVQYEWDVETVDENGDILDHRFCDSFAEARRIQSRDGGEIVLVRDSTDGRTWAYAGTAGLPPMFADAWQHPTTPVPVRFHAETVRAILSNLEH